MLQFPSYGGARGGQKFVNILQDIISTAVVERSRNIGRNLIFWQNEISHYIRDDIYPSYKVHLEWRIR